MQVTKMLETRDYGSINYIYSDEVDTISLEYPLQMPYSECPG